MIPNMELEVGVQRLCLIQSAEEAQEQVTQEERMDDDNHVRGHDTAQDIIGESDILNIGSCVRIWTHWIQTLL